jgi:vancomycin permeability regulator SanA
MNEMGIDTGWRMTQGTPEFFVCTKKLRAVFASAALAAFVVTPGLADYYIVQEPTTKRCRIVEERPAPSVGVVIGGADFGVRTEAESRMRTVEECREERERVRERQ